MSPDEHPTVRVRVGDLGPGDTRLFPFEREGERLTGIVVHHDGGLHVYVNRCPHVTFSLDLGDDDVTDASGQFLMCHVHGAMFLPESGECFMGPVVGRRLERLPFQREGDTLVVRVTPEPPGWPDQE
ncbi:MAG: Rieske (2Fe-2S) protein [Myxococcota bacterium]